MKGGAKHKEMVKGGSMKRMVKLAMLILAGSLYGPALMSVDESRVSLEKRTENFCTYISGKLFDAITMPEIKYTPFKRKASVEQQKKKKMSASIQPEQLLQESDLRAEEERGQKIKKSTAEEQLKKTSAQKVYQNPLAVAMNKEVLGMKIGEIVKPEFIKAINEKVCLANATVIVAAIDGNNPGPVCKLLVEQIPVAVRSGFDRLRLPSAISNATAKVVGAVVQQPLFAELLCPLAVQAGFLSKLPDAVKMRVADLKADLPAAASTEEGTLVEVSEEELGF